MTLTSQQHVPLHTFLKDVWDWGKQQPQTQTIDYSDRTLLRNRSTNKRGDQVHRSMQNVPYYTLAQTGRKFCKVPTQGATLESNQEIQPSFKDDIKIFATDASRAVSIEVDPLLALSVNILKRNSNMQSPLKSPSQVRSVE